LYNGDMYKLSKCEMGYVCMSRISSLLL